MKSNALQTVSFRLSPAKLSQLSDVAEILRKDRKLIEHPNRQQLLQEALDDFINKYLKK